METSNKKLLVLLGIIIVIVIIIVVAAKQSGQKTNTPNNQANTSDNTTNVATPEEVVNVPGGRVEIPGASIINKDNVVVTQTGVVTKNDVMPVSPEAPRAVTVAKGELPKQAVNIEIGNNTVKPKSFSVSANAPVSLAFTSIDDKVHVVSFDDGVLAALSWGIGKGQTRAITFNAPSKPGTYEFYCGVPGHRAAGEVGQMIVK